MKSRPFLPKQYRLSDLRAQLDVPSVPSDMRTVHTLFAIMIRDVDRKADIPQDLQQDLLEGLAQGWLYFAENHSGVDVLVEHTDRSVDTEIDDPSGDRPASSYPYRHGAESRFDETLFENVDDDVTREEFEREMRELDDLRRQTTDDEFDSDAECRLFNLRRKYNISHGKFWSRSYLADRAESTSDSRTRTTSTMRQ